MTSYFEIAGQIIELDDLDAYSPFELGVIAAERLEQRRNSAKAESVRSGANETGESRPGLMEHYLRSLWFGASEPTKRVWQLFNPKSMSFRTTPKHLILFAADIAADHLENQYEYFVLGERPDY